MKKRNQKICDMIVLPGARVLCAAFGQYTKSLFASGDDKNNVQIWKLQKEKSLCTMNYSSNSTAQVEVSAINFNSNEQLIFSGSNRGIINIWDVNIQKQNSTLKGHVAAVNSLTFSPNDQSVLFSGAYDTLIKLWDLRQKNSTTQFKGHSNQINCLAISPDGRMLSSGSHDGLVKIWDIGSQRCLQSFPQHDAPVNCLRYNPVDKALATGGNDRTVKYWDLDSYSLISQTRPDATSIQCIAFEPNGKYTFSGAHESLKVWNLGKDGILLDNVESGWRGLQDLIVINEQLYGLAAQGQQGFSLYCLSLSTINTIEIKQDRLIQRNNTRGKTPDQRNSQANQPSPQVPQQQVQIDYQQRFQSNDENKMIPNPIRQKPNLAFQGRNILNSEQLYNTQDEDKFRPGTASSENNSNIALTPSPLIQNQNQAQPQNIFFNQQILPTQQYIPSISPLQHKILNQNNQQMNPQLYGNNQFLMKPNNIEFEEEIKVPDQEMQIEESTISQDILASGKDLNFSQFILGDQKEKFKQIDLMSEINKEHTKVIQILKQRMNYMKPIIHWWNSGNIKSSVNAINQYRIHSIIIRLNEPSIILDALSMCCQSQKFPQMNLEYLPQMLEKSKVLIESKYQSHIKGGLEFIQKSLVYFKDDIINIKQFQGLSKGDIMREERIQKCDKVIAQYRQIVQMPKLNKVIDRNKEDISQLAKNLQAELLIFLKRSTQNSIQLA